MERTRLWILSGRCLACLITVRYIPLDIFYACFSQRIHSLAGMAICSDQASSFIHLPASSVPVVFITTTTSASRASQFHSRARRGRGPRMDGEGERAVGAEQGYDLILNICVRMTNVTCNVRTSSLVLYMRVGAACCSCPPKSAPSLHSEPTGMPDPWVSSSRQA